MTSAPPDADIRLYYRPGSAALAPHGALLATGVEPELVYVERDGDAVDPPDYVRLNPMGVVPTLVHGDVVVTEAAAVVQYVADTWPDAALLPRPGTRDRVRAVELLAFLSTTPQQAMLRFLYPERYTTGADASGVREAAVVALERQLSWLESVVAGQGALLGADVSAVDFYLHMLIRWGRRLDPDARTRGALGPYYRRLSEHPPVALALERQGLEA
jgi:glutathione S-transferase